MLYFSKYENPLSFDDLELIYEIIENQKTTDKDEQGQYEVWLENGTVLEYEILEDYSIVLINWT